MKKTIAKNVIANWVGLVSQIAVVFLLTPLVIRSIGLEAYGLWLFLQSLGGYYGFVDAGLRVGIGQSVTRRIAGGDVDGIRQLLSTAIPVLALLASLILVIALPVAAFMSSVIEISEPLQRGLFAVVMLQAFSVAIQLPFAPFGAVLFGYQRFELDNAITICLRVFSALVIWRSLANGYGLVSLSLIAAFTSLFNGIARMFVAMGICKSLREIRFNFCAEVLFELWRFGVWNSIILVGRQMIYLTDSLVVGLVTTPRHVAYYGISGSIIEYFNEILGSAARVLFPAIVHMDVNSTLERQRNLYVTATRYLTTLALVVFAVGSAWFQPFVKFWLGSSDDVDTICRQAYPVFIILGLAVIMATLQRVGMQLLLAKQRFKTLALLLGAEALLNLVISIIAGELWGITGVAFGTLIPAVIFTVGFHIPKHAKLLGTTTFELTLRVAARPILFILLYLPSVYFLCFLLASPVRFHEFLLIALICALAGIGIAVATVVDGNDRKAIARLLKARFAFLL